MPQVEKLERQIIQKTSEIISQEQAVREHINTTRYQADLIEDLGNWNQICCSLDTVGDTLLSIQTYIETEHPKNTGLKYTFTYGLLQALFIQQDAIRHLSEAFSIEFQLSDKMQQIRLLRNASIGHPTKNNFRGATSYNYISRMSLSKTGFTLMRSFQEGRDEFIDINLYTIIRDQLDDIETKYKTIADKLIETDKMHKEKFRDKQLIDIFHSAMRYYFEKIAQGIHSPSDSNTSFGLSMLEGVQETYKKFEAALQERGDLHDHIKYDLEEYNHALSKLSSYFQEENSSLSEKDARIYHFYIQEQHNHFEQIAKEIDTEYLERSDK